MPSRPDPNLSIEDLRKRYVTLNEQRISTSVHLKNAEESLDKLKAEARESWGTDELEALQKRLEEMTRDNEQRRDEYERHLAKIEADLADVERNFGER